MCCWSAPVPSPAKMPVIAMPTRPRTSRHRPKDREAVSASKELILHIWQPAFYELVSAASRNSSCHVKPVGWQPSFSFGLPGETGSSATEPASPDRSHSTSQSRTPRGWCCTSRSTPQQQPLSAQAESERRRERAPSGDTAHSTQRCLASWNTSRARSTLQPRSTGESPIEIQKNVNHTNTRRRRPPQLGVRSPNLPRPARCQPDANVARWGATEVPFGNVRHDVVRVHISCTAF